MKQIEELINRYLDGLTSNEEERTLKRFFAQAGGDIPEEWKALQTLFAFESMDSQLPEETDHAKIVSIRHRNKMLRIIISTAACIAITLIFHLGHSASYKNYAVIDGKKYTNPEVVRQQAFKALNEVSSDDRETFSALTE